MKKFKQSRHCQCFTKAPMVSVVRDNFTLNYILQVKNWATTNKLMLNDGKTEVIHFVSKFIPRQPQPISLIIGQSKVNLSQEAWNLGAIMDCLFSMKSHIKKTCRAAMTAIRDSGQIRNFLDESTTNRLVHAFVTPRLDSRNSLLYYQMPSWINFSAFKTQLPPYWSGLQETSTSPQFFTVCIGYLTRIVSCLSSCHSSSRLNMVSLPTTSLNSPYAHQRHLRAQCLLQIPQRVLTMYYGARALSTAASKLWNCLPIQESP